jgi:phage terminase large subunit
MMAVLVGDSCKACFLCTRQVQLSIADSIHRLIVGVIRRQGMEDRFKITDNYITNKITGSEYIFKGMTDIKSLEGIDVAIVEEAQTVTHERGGLLVPTIRTEGSQIWWLWNPSEETDYVSQEFQVGALPPNTVIEQVNYTDNAYCPQVLIDEAEAMRVKNPALYKHIWLGEFKPKGEGWTLINPAWLDHARSGQVRPLEPMLMGRWSIGCDPAFQGRDDWATVEGRGNRVEAVNVWGYEAKDGQDMTNRIAGYLYGRVMERGRFNVDLGVDCVGTGIGVGDTLAGRYGLGDCLNRLNRKDVKWQPPMPASGSAVAYRPEQFDNWRSQAWWQLRCDLEMGNIDLSPIWGTEQWGKLERELLAHGIEDDPQHRLRVTPKEKLRDKKILGWSPGRADALVAWNWVRRRNTDYARGLGSSSRYEVKPIVSSIF